MAQNSIKVKYQGAKPTISDFATAFLKAYVYDENDDVLDESRSYMKSVWMQHLKGERLEATDELTVDKANGFISLESYDDNDMLLVEMCYWNESDGRHKLFAYNVRCFRNGKYSPGQFDGLTVCHAQAKTSFRRVGTKAERKKRRSAGTDVNSASRQERIESDKLTGFAAC